MTDSPKSPSQSTVETRYVLMPQHANPMGTAFGGVIMSWIDLVAAMTAQRHAGMAVVTAGIDSLSFKEPIHIGDHVVLRASVNYVSRSSMEVGVQVRRERPLRGESVVATTAHLTFVALDEEGRPSIVPKIVPATDDEKRRFENAKIRVRARKELLKKTSREKP